MIHMVVDERRVCAPKVRNLKKRQIPKNVAIGCVVLRWGRALFGKILHPTKRLQERDPSPDSDKVAQGRGRQDKEAAGAIWSQKLEQSHVEMSGSNAIYVRQSLVPNGDG